MISWSLTRPTTLNEAEFDEKVFVGAQDFA